MLHYSGHPALCPAGHRRASDVQIRSGRIGHMGVKAVLSGTPFLPPERRSWMNGWRLLHGCVTDDCVAYRRA